MVWKIAHRGGANYYEENSIEAFTSSAYSVDMIEFDVRKTKDNELLVIHDEKINRTTNGKGYVKKMTLSEIKQYKITNGETIPTLEETINVLNAKTTMMIELKEQGIEELILKKLRSTTDKIITSFYEESITKIKEINPKIKTGLIFGNKKQRAMYYPLQFVLPKILVSWAKRSKAELIIPHYSLISEKLVEEAHKNNKHVITWVVNKQKDIDSMFKYGVDGIISDNPYEI